MTSIVTLLVTTLFNSVPNTLATTQELPALILAVMLSTYAAHAELTDADLVATSIVTISLAGILTGIFFFVVGRFKLAGLVRFVPYPVLGGFLAGTGWLLVQGSIGTMASVPLEWGTLSTLMQLQELMLWIPGMLIGAALLIGSEKINHFLALPGMLFMGFVVFYVVFFASGMSIEQGIEQGFLLGEIARDLRWQPLLFQSLPAANWGLILTQAGNYITLLVLVLVNILLGLSSLELVFRSDIDVNRELQAGGIANIASGLMGGMVGFQDLGQTTLNYRMGVRGRLASFTVAGVCLIVLFLGSNFLMVLPKAMLGSVIFYLGIVYLNEWILEGYHKFNRIDYAIIWIIMVAMATMGLLAGVAVGLGLTVLVFVWQYSKVSIFHQKFSGADYRSNVERHPHHERELNKLRGQIYILELQGFIFFGTAYSLIAEIQSRLANASMPPLKYVILDFSRVRAVDVSAMLSFEKVLHLAELKDFVVIFVDFQAHSAQKLTFMDDEDFKARIQTTPDLDRAIEWCEEQLLDTHGVTQAIIASTIVLQLKEMGFDTAHARKFVTYLEKQERQQGEYLIQQGDEANDMFFIEVGMVSILLETDKEHPLRVRTMNMGTVVGELGFYLNEKRTASVVVDVRSRVYRFSREAGNRMLQEDAELAAVFNAIMVKLVARRLATTNQALTAMSQ
jgi:SulP family sulfate permease